MEKKHSQLELFSQIKVAGGMKSQGPVTFFTYIRNYEKNILLAISFLITGIISFCLGVERGKQITVYKDSSYFDLAAKPLQQTESKPTLIPAKENASAYTIQVASYLTMQHAQKEAEALKKKGFTTLILSKGKYNVLCVGNFASKENAHSILGELKKRYQDCLIRRL